MIFSSKIIENSGSSAYLTVLGVIGFLWLFCFFCFVVSLLVNLFCFDLVFIIPYKKCIVTSHGFCISLMTNDAQHLFMCLFVIWIFSLLNCLVKYFAIIYCFEYFLIKFLEFFIFLTTNPLSHINFETIFSQFMSYHFILITLPFEEQKFTIWIKFNSIFFSIMDCVFVVIYKKYLFNSRFQWFSPYVSSRSFIALRFCFVLFFGLF